MQIKTIYPSIIQTSDIVAGISDPNQGELYAVYAQTNPCLILYFHRSGQTKSSHFLVYFLGDTNPIHTLPDGQTTGAVVHGALLMGYVSGAIGANCPGAVVTQIEKVRLFPLMRSIS